MRNLEAYRAYFDTAYPDYGDREYGEISHFVSSLPSMARVNKLLGDENACSIRDMILPVIKIKNYKSQIPFPIELYEAIRVVAEIKNSEPLENLSEHHVVQFNKLLGTQGFQLPTVSAVLHFCHPTFYPIVDRNIEAACGLLAKESSSELSDNPPALPASTTSNNNKLNKYQSFISFLSKVKELHNVQRRTNYTFRDLDKALMVYGAESFRVIVDNAKNV